MSRITSDPNDPRLGHGSDDTPRPQNEVYLVLSEEERAKGLLRPLRYSYVHVGPPGPRYQLRDLTNEERERFAGAGYVKFETFPEGIEGSATGRFWKQEQLDAAGKGCGSVTSMGQALAETYARNPQFYGATYCVTCQMHRPVGRDGEFVWDGTHERVGT